MHQMNLSNPDVRRELLSCLVKGMRIDEVKACAMRCISEPEGIPVILELLEHPEEYRPIQLQKGAWVLYHAFQLDPRCLMLHRKALGRVLDATENESVLRELLKILATPMWLDIESIAERAELRELGLELLLVEDAALALHYAALQIIQTRSILPEEREQAQRSIRAVRMMLPDQSSPLARCMTRHEKKLDQKLARTKSPN